MRTMPMTDGMGRMAELCEGVVREHERIVLTRPDGNVVLVAEDEWDNMVETLRVLHDEPIMHSLRESFEARAAGTRPPGKSIEEVFSDVVNQHPEAG